MLATARCTRSASGHSSRARPSSSSQSGSCHRVPRGAPAHAPQRAEAGRPPGDRTRRALPDLGEPLPGVAHEPRLALLEPQLDLAGGPVAVLGELEIDDLAVGLL